MDAHENEYRAAVAGLPDQTPSGTGSPAIGDWVWGDSCGRSWQGRLVELEQRRAVVEVDGGWLSVDPKDIGFWHRKTQAVGDGTR